MPQQTTELTFELKDTIDGAQLSPANVDLPTLSGFLEDVQTLLKGDIPGATLVGTKLRIEHGSLRVVALVALAIAIDFQSDIAKLNDSGDLDVLQPKRAQILEQWQGRARKHLNRQYVIGGTSLSRPLLVESSTRFQHGSENAWVAVEKYLTGKVVDLGGKQKPIVHLILADSGESLRINTSEGQIAAETENQVYRHVTVRVQGEQHLRTKALRNLRLVDFLHHTAEVDEQALTALWAKGREAWKDVKSATEWVQDLRGSH